MLIHFLLGPSVGGLFGLIGYAINRGDPNHDFRRELALLSPELARVGAREPGTAPAALMLASRRRCSSDSLPGWAW